MLVSFSRGSGIRPCSGAPHLGYSPSFFSASASAAGRSSTPVVEDGLGEAYKATPEAFDVQLVCITIHAVDKLIKLPEGARLRTGPPVRIHLGCITMRSVATFVLSCFREFVYSAVRRRSVLQGSAPVCLVLWCSTEGRPDVEAGAHLGVGERVKGGWAPGNAVCIPHAALP
jgi:hypothetical protein